MIIALAVAGAFVGGMLNTAAVGGSVLTFLALLAVGLDPHAANATNLVLIVASFLPTMRRMPELSSPVLWMAGGKAAGLALLVITSAVLFRAVVPWLLLLAAVLLVLGFLRPSAHQSDRPVVRAAALVGTGVFAGYFAGSTGTLLFLVLWLTTTEDLREINRTKNAVALVLTVMSLALLAVPGSGVHYGWLALLAVPNFVGGWLGVRLADRLPVAALRVLIAGTALAAAGWLLIEL